MTWASRVIRQDRRHVIESLPAAHGLKAKPVAELRKHQPQVPFRGSGGPAGQQVDVRRERGEERRIIESHMSDKYIERPDED